MQPGADIGTHVDVGDVDRDNLKGSVGVEPTGQHCLGDHVGVFQNVGMLFGRADRRDDPLPHPRDDRFLGGPADELVEVGAHRDAGPHLELDAVFGHRIERLAATVLAGAIDHLGIDARLHRLADISAGQIDGGGQLEIEFLDLRLVGGDEGLHHQRHAAAGEIVGLQRLPGDAGGIAQPCLHGHDLAAHDDGGVHLLEAHRDQIKQSDAGA